jgi:tRNA-splicing ligase RtcB (3'-phosphate/5'-hydroxy nucleic acid ligase)
MEIIRTSQHPIYAWTEGVEFEAEARAQVAAMASLPFIHDHIAIMPDVHVGKGATVGSVIPTVGAIVPAAVGVDIGCGMVAQRLSLRASDLPDNLRKIRNAIERSIPVGFKDHGRVPAVVESAWEPLERGLDAILAKYPKIDNHKALKQLGTMGGGNHFFELTIDLEEHVWLVLHSGSRGIGNKIGTFFIAKAKEEMQHAGVDLPNRDLAYLTENTESFDDYVQAVEWAQTYARTNRDVMLELALEALRASDVVPDFSLAEKAVNSHHNYIAREQHFGREVYVTRKGAVSAREGELGIIPGSMGARSFIVRGKGNADSFHSCSHGAGRRMSRGEAHRKLTVADLVRQTEGVECRKDHGVLDEAPAAYKDIGAVMKAQRDLVEIVHEFRQVLCVKG